MLQEDVPSHFGHFRWPKLKSKVTFVNQICPHLLRKMSSKTTFGHLKLCSINRVFSVKREATFISEGIFLHPACGIEIQDCKRKLKPFQALCCVIPNLSRPLKGLGLLVHQFAYFYKHSSVCSYCSESRLFNPSNFEISCFGYRTLIECQGVNYWISFSILTSLCTEIICFQRPVVAPPEVLYNLWN